jgi:hypothetical protein
MHSFVFFSTFEVLDLTKLHEQSPTPCLYVAPAANTVGRVPLSPPFLWKLDFNDTSHVQQAQGFRLPVWLC